MSQLAIAQSTMDCSSSAEAPAYAAWTGIGIMGPALVGAAIFHEALSAGQVVSLVLILAGVAGLKMFSS